MLNPIDEKRASWFYRYGGRLFDRITAAYGRLLHTVLEYQGMTLLIAILTLVLTVILYLVIPKGFFPIQDTGVIQGISEAPQSISFKLMAERQQVLSERILQDPAVASVSSLIGVDGINPTLNTGRLLITLKPLEVRNVSVNAVIRRLQAQLERHGWDYFIFAAITRFDHRKSHQSHPIPIYPGRCRCRPFTSLGQSSGRTTFRPARFD